MNLFKRLFGRKQAEEVSPEKEAGRDRGILTVNTDNLSKEGRQGIWEEIGKQTNLPIYKGKVEHGYSRRTVSQTGQCPRCQAKTLQHYANFIYATDIAPRVMFVPAGFFCAHCPTVIIDEEMIAGGVKKGFCFQGVVGIDYEGKKEPDLFRTWNGKEAVYIFDENKNVIGLSGIDSTKHHEEVPQISTKDKLKLKRKRQMARKARKRNRNRR
jgi:hypothetical protein